MKFLRLPDSLLSILFEDEDIVAIDKPYGFNAHTNDSKIENSEFIQDGLIEMYEKQFEKKLHIIHRLDQTTTGVMIFGKSVESAKKYAQYFFDRQVKKTYWFITKSQSKKTSFIINQQIVHKGKDLDASTDLIFLKRSSTYELWQANPHTGRNHQIRIHALAAKISILGDTKYEGHDFPFLCLHNCRIEFPNGIIISSRPPVYFEDLSLLEDAVLVRAFFESDRRLRLFSSGDQDQCFRLVHNKNNSKNPGFTIDQFGQVMILHWHKERWQACDLKSFTIFATAMKKALVVNQSGSQFVIYPSVESKILDSKWIVKENKTKYFIGIGISQSDGLCLNQRLQRSWVLNNSKDKSVLDLFSYTAGYALAASVGKSSSTTSVEANKKYINRARENFELNQINPSSFKFLCRDSQTFLEQSITKGNKYNLIICDAPSFLRLEKGFFKIEKDLEKLLENCFRCLADKGELLFSTNFDKFFIDDIRNAISIVQKKLKIKKIEINCILPSLDFELPDEKANLKSFLIRIDDSTE